MSKSSRFRVIAMRGEGIGPEIVSAACEVLTAVQRRFDVRFDVVDCVVGLDAISQEGTPFPTRVEQLCDEASRDGQSAILFGAVSDEPIGILRQRYDLYINLRPARLWPGLDDASPLRRELVEGLDVLVVRELVSGIYYGEAKSGVGSAGRWESQALYYDEAQIARIVRAAFEVAAKRPRKQLTYVHKGNVVKGVFALWAEIVENIARDFSTVSVNSFLVDNLAAQLVRKPKQFDVILAENMFGDILSDLLAGVVGSIGMLPSASLNGSKFGLYEGIGGTAPDIAGKGIANPIATILSAAMMLRTSFGLEDAARTVESAVMFALGQGRTADIASPTLPVLGTAEMTKLICSHLSHP